MTQEWGKEGPPQGGDVVPAAPALIDTVIEAVLARNDLGGPEKAPDALRERVEALVALARRYHLLRRARRTEEEYRKSSRAFVRWCGALGLDPLSTDVVGLYLAARAGEDHVTPSTLDQNLAAIQALFRELKVPLPRDSSLVRGVRAGIRRAHGVAPKGKAPLRGEHLRRLIGTLPASRRGARDKALLLVGWLGAFRRSELASLEVEDLAFEPEGLKIRLRRSKTDPEGEGRTVAIPKDDRKDLCAVEAVKAWMEAGGVVSGPLFREVNRHDQVGASAVTGGSVARIVKRACREAGLNAERFSGHSLRAGFVSAAASAGVPEREIMRQTAHRSERMVRRYIREEQAFLKHPAKGLL
jgi:integrase